jgi:hypothetical protein
MSRLLFPLKYDFPFLVEVPRLLLNPDFRSRGWKVMININHVTRDFALVPVLPAPPDG